MKKIKISEKQFVKLQEDLEYWSVSDASPSTDTYEMGVDINEESTQNIVDYKKVMSSQHEEYFTNTHILPHIIKYLDSIINIDMIVKSNDNSSTYTVYFDNVEEISQHYCYGCSGTFHYPTGTHDIYTTTNAEDNDQFVSAVELALIDVFGGDLSNMEFYSIIYKYLFNKIKRYMDNDRINDYPEEHDMDY